MLSPFGAIANLAAFERRMTMRSGRTGMDLIVTERTGRRARRYAMVSETAVFAVGIEWALINRVVSE